MLNWTMSAVYGLKAREVIPAYVLVHNFEQGLNALCISVLCVFVFRSGGQPLTWVGWLVIPTFVTDL